LRALLGRDGERPAARPGLRLLWAQASSAATDVPRVHLVAACVAADERPWPHLVVRDRPSATAPGLCCTCAVQRSHRGARRRSHLATRRESGCVARRADQSNRSVQHSYRRSRTRRVSAGGRCLSSSLDERISSAERAANVTHQEHCPARSELALGLPSARWSM